MKRIIVLPALLAFFVVEAHAAELPLAKPTRQFLADYCTGCHNADDRAGRLNLDALLDKPMTAETEALWVRVHDRTRNGEMPPSKKARPPAPERDAALSDLAKSLKVEQLKVRAIEGRTAVRRLNRREIENTLRDLLELPGLNVLELLPEDGRAFGYDKSADALDVSAIQLAKYAEAIDVALSEAVAHWAVPPPSVVTRMYANEQYDFGIVIPNGDGVMLKDGKYDDSRFPLPDKDYAGGKYKGLHELEKSGVWKERPGTAGLFRSLGEAFSGRFNRYAPIYSGKYRITTSVWSFWWDRGEVKPAPRSGAAGIYYGGRVLGFFEAPSMTPKTHQWIAQLEPGQHLKFDPASLWEVHPYHHQGKAAKFVGPAVAIDFLEIEGPLIDEWPPASHKRLFGDMPLVPVAKLDANAVRPERVPPRQTTGAINSPNQLIPATVTSTQPAADAERLLKAFLPRAFRRPIVPAETARYTALVLQRLADGACFEDALKSAIKAALLSPDMLLIREPVGVLDDYALATRLSYFLWNSMPDDALTALASAGTLKEPVTLQAQTERMLGDPKADRFVQDFTDQWLDVRNFSKTTPDRRLYPEFQLYLAEAMRREPSRYFETILRENQPVEKLVRSDFTVVNQRLAEHYRLPGVVGPNFRRVALPGLSVRGGFLTMAATMKVTADGTTTSPVKRGAWVNAKLLGLPPQQPPPNIAAVEPDVRGTVTIREQLAKHRDNASCAGCHAKIDPPGFALESFDVLGGFRERYRSTGNQDAPNPEALFVSHLTPEGKFPGMHSIGFRNGPPVDASGTTPEGKAFQGIQEYRAMLASDSRTLARNLAEQWLVYATGAPCGFADRDEREKLLDRSGGDYRLRTLLLELIQSPLFRTR